MTKKTSKTLSVKEAFNTNGFGNHTNLQKLAYYLHYTNDTIAKRQIEYAGQIIEGRH